MVRDPGAAPPGSGEDGRVGEPADNLDILGSFRQEPDGTWHCVSPVTIATPIGAVRAEMGEVFAFGQKAGGLDVAEYLEQLGASFGS